MPDLASSQRFWDAKASENPYWYVSSFVDFSRPDLTAFWASGAAIWGDLKARTGYHPTSADTVVEIGCGVGRLTRAIAPEVGAVHAFDISPNMIAQAARAAPPNASFHLTGGDDLRPLASNSADFVLAYLVLQHLPNRRVYARYLQEMARVAKPAGTIVFTTSPRDWKVLLLPLLRAKSWLAMPWRRDGPQGLYQREWTGIRPSRQTTLTLCPIPVSMKKLPNQRWLFWGTKPA